MGNIADMTSDAIVLPANSWLKEGSGSSRAIFKKAGKRKLQEACDEIVKKYGKLDITDSFTTPGFDTNASVIIHAVVPKWIDGQSDEYVNLLLTYRNALATADELGFKSIAFPLLAAGNNGFDLSIALEIAQSEISNYEQIKQLTEVNLVLYDSKAIELVRRQGNKIEIFGVNVASGKRRLFHKPFLKKEDIINNAKAAFDVYKNVKKFCEENPEIVEFARDVVDRIIRKYNEE